MALTSLSQIRRKELRTAAFRVLMREGVDGMTLEKVAAEAGGSKGIVLHYFRSKDELFDQVMREANLVLRNHIVARLKQVDGPLDRLFAIIDGNFADDYFTRATTRAWLALCAEVPRNPALARIQRILHARMHSNLCSALRPLVGAGDCNRIALELSALIDGLWLRLALTPGPLTGAEAAAIVKTSLTARLAKPAQG